MKKLKLIAVILCSLMLMQVLPISRIGAMISKNQWTEELPHGTSAEEEPVKMSDFSSASSLPYIPAATNSSISVFTEWQAAAYIDYSTSIPSNHSADIVSPPPDAIA